MAMATDDTVLARFGNTFVQTVFCCKQPNGDYCCGLYWRPQGARWNSYDSSELPPTLDKGADTKRFVGRDWRDAKRYAESLCRKYGLSLAA